MNGTSPPNEIATPKTALLIVNPHSRQGAEAELSDGIALLEQAGFKLFQVDSHSPSQTEREIYTHRNQIDLVILGGGDGTIGSAAAVLYRYRLPLAILPLGTANDLARSLGIPQDVPSAFKIIVDNHRRKVDLGIANGRYFFNAANIGLGVNITYELTPEVKKTWGVFSYAKALFAALSRKRVFKVTMMVDGRRRRTHSIQLAVGNGRYYGGGNVIDEYSTIDDGLLHLYSIHPQTVWELITLAPLLRDGKQRLAKRTFCVSGQRIEIKTSPEMEVHADGEPVTHTPVVFEVIPRALVVFAPALPDPNESKSEDVAS